MASLAHTIHRFQSGSLTHGELISQVDQMLAQDQTNAAQLTEILNEERTRTLLPPDVYAELQSRAQPRSDERTADPGVPPLQTGPHSRMTLSVPRSDDVFIDPAAGAERMKGVGDTLNGRFVLEECIGFGGMGVVYKALDLRKLEASDRNPYIAIKVLNVQFRGHPKSLIALQREAKKAQTLAHPNIVTVYDFDRDGTMVYLTMEYLEGKPLSHLLREPGFSGMPYENAMHVVSGMGKALAYAHERGFVHCDFKPANVILSDKGEVKVIDFGIARVFHKPAEETEATVFDPGSLGGLTPAYASPEMLEHREPDPRDDIYALACITYELLTGHHPFDRLTAAQARNAAMKPQRPKNLGHAQWRALRNALAFERDKRTPSVARFLQEMGVERKGANPAVALAASTVAVTLVATGTAFWWASSQRNAERTVTADAGPSAPAPPVAKESTPATPAPQPTPPQPAAPALTVAGVNRLLAQVPCSALLPTVSNYTLQVSGFLPASYGAARLKEMLGRESGARSVTVDVQQVSDEKCGPINMFAPYWKQNRQAGGAATLHTRPRNAKLTEGDKLMLDVTTPGYDSYVNVDYYSFDGSVVHMVPSPRAKANQAPPNYSATIGDMGDWVVSKPFGTDLVVLMITPAPLFDTLRPVGERAPDYLPAVERQLKQIVGRNGGDRIMVEFLQVTTGARK